MQKIRSLSVNAWHAAQKNHLGGGIHPPPYLDRRIISVYVPMKSINFQISRTSNVGRAQPLFFV